jgi:hypothetical protein
MMTSILLRNSPIHKLSKELGVEMVTRKLGRNTAKWRSGTPDDYRRPMPETPGGAPRLICLCLFAGTLYIGGKHVDSPRRGGETEIHAGHREWMAISWRRIVLAGGDPYGWL